MAIPLTPNFKLEQQRRLQAAESYASEGLVVIPLDGKIPTWKHWQHKNVTEGIVEIRRRAARGNLGNIGIVAGANSGNTLQLEIDGLSLYHLVLEDFPQLKNTRTVLSGGGDGAHIYVRADQLPPTTVALEKGQHLEIRLKSDGQQCVAPPSIHPDTGNEYTLLVDAEIKHLDQATMDALVAFIDARRPRPKANLPPSREIVIAPSSPGDKRPYALAALDGMAQEVARLTDVKNDPQNDTMHLNTGKLAAYARFGDLTRSEVFAAMENAMRANGYIGGFSYHQFAKSFESGWNYGLTSGYVPQCYQEGFKPKKSVQHRIEKALLKANDGRLSDLPFVADHTVNMPLLTGLPAGVKSAGIQSGVGTFKTGLTVQEMGREPGRALYLTHTKELAGQFVARAEQAGVTVELYSEMLKSDLYRANRLSACINTLVLYVKQTGAMPPAPALLIVDEISQFVEGLLIGGTMEGDELHIADQVFRHQLANAARVLVMDAHLSAAALAYVRSARPDIQTVVNTYQTPRGNLHLCEKRGRAISGGIAAVMEGKRVAFAVFSVKEGQAIADQLASVIGCAEDVLFVHAGNRGEARQSAFLDSPNTETQKYRAVIYSPVIGTGYSIDPQIDVLVALANSQQSAEDVRQFIGRYRNVTDSYVYLPNNQSVREIDAQAITDRLIAAAERTAHPYVEDGRLHRSVSPQALSYAHHHGAVRAGRNASQNQLQERFVRLCVGSYSIKVIEGDDSAISAVIRARVADIDAQRRELALTVPRVDKEAFKRKQDAGLVSEADHAGHTAWLIENMVGGFNETWRDRLWTEQKRKAAARIADLYDSIEALTLSDMEEAAFDNPLHTRKHRVERRIITEAFLRPLINSADELVEYSAAELEAIYRPIIEHHAEGLRLYFGWYAYRTNTVPGVLRLILRRMDLTLSGTRRRVAGQANPVQFYVIEEARYRANVTTARAVVAKRVADRLQAYEGRIAPPVRKLQNAVVSPSVAESVHPDKSQLMGWAAEPERFDQQFTAALGVPTKRRLK